MCELISDSEIPILLFAFHLRFRGTVSLSSSVEQKLVNRSCWTESVQQLANHRPLEREAFYGSPMSIHLHRSVRQCSVAKSILHWFCHRSHHLHTIFTPIRSIVRAFTITLIVSPLLYLLLYLFYCILIVSLSYPSCSISLVLYLSVLLFAQTQLTKPPPLFCITHSSTSHSATSHS